MVVDTQRPPEGGLAPSRRSFWGDLPHCSTRGNPGPWGGPIWPLVGACYSRAAMEALAWTAVGLLAAALLGSFAAFFYLGMRIDALGDHLAYRIDAMSDRISAQSARIDAQTSRIRSQSATIQARSWDFIPHIRTEGRAMAAAMQVPSARIGTQEATLQALGRDLTAAIQAQGRELAAAIQAQGQEFGARIDALTARMDEHLGRHAG